MRGDAALPSLAMVSEQRAADSNPKVVARRGEVVEAAAVPLKAEA